MMATGAELLPSGAARLLSALLYGACSLLLVLLNKALLTAYGFPSPIVLGIGQMAATIMILFVAKLNKIIHFPDFDKRIPAKLFPLPLLYIGNHLSGLSSTGKLSLPMFTVLRKFTIPLTLLLETIVLGKQHSLDIVASVFAIVLGAVVAAGSDLAFNLEGYIFVFLNDIFTAANGVYTKQKMDPKELGKYGVLFYNACFMIIPTFIISVSTGDFQQLIRRSPSADQATPFPAGTIDYSGPSARRVAVRALLSTHPHQLSDPLIVPVLGLTPQRHGWL
ncbi:UDP-N-acetylglucosamine/UDP-glucose/GDP-mannose transporter isoform X4 [Fukomys damarensis]|uniref:UDP-N-acetylglucosamine/UDP-glucose/GDP-mannose transporter isoform X4 n=1 Tax=Fukomys damarensis TaxID=885580 RepID=UPI00053F346D|nr:UDP-N-acetylglucosamine/UDP-glucose/GDP-mannose transporter isoform X4 [Fukomys damarensis]